MKTCKTCKYWSRDKIQELVSGECIHPFTNSDSMPRRKNYIFAIEEQGYITIVTGPNFGCINHEEK